MKRTLILFQKAVRAVGCANGQGGKHLGCESAVSILRNSPHLKNVKVPIEWSAVVEEVATGRQWNALQGVTQTNRRLARETRKVIESGEDLVVFGGDHSCAIGTWSGIAAALRPRGELGLIWVDAHMDAHTPESTPSGNIHGMPVSHLLGFGEKNLIQIEDQMPKIFPHNFCMVGIRSYEEGEQELLEKLGVRIFYMHEVERRGITDVMQEAVYIATRNSCGFGMSIDIDGFDVSFAPAVGTPAEGGINAEQFMKALLTVDLSKLVATEIVEFLPRFDDQNKTSERLVASLVESIYATKFFQQNSAAHIKQQVQISDKAAEVIESRQKQQQTV
ncbi:hypothetical protein WR25_23901 [Diploscapter pachys]|uniref:Arginase n=1 Tax=Diploscapter pachys TaxID=2018661 RepID=A0A2A2LJ69_9BILA|nr:hypothetical protein WR25_23901 [Diploscapter pachys]